MNPALLNYLQQGELNRSQSNSYNPFDSGIQKAIDSARQSLGMTQQQKDKAFNNALLTFASTLGNQPRERGFRNNLYSIGNAVIPAMQQYNRSEDLALNENKYLADEIMNYQQAEMAARAAAEDKAWRQSMEERRFAESVRANNLLDDYRRQQLNLTKQKFNNESREEKPLRGSSSGKSNRGSHKNESSNSMLSKILNESEKTLNKYKESGKGYRNRGSGILDRFVPGGYVPSEEEFAIDVLGDLLKGSLFNKFNYRNMSEFEHVPSISSKQPVQNNLKALQILKNLSLENPLENNDILEQSNINQENIPQENIPQEQQIWVIDPDTGQKELINASELEEAVSYGLQPLKE